MPAVGRAHDAEAATASGATAMLRGKLALGLAAVACSVVGWLAWSPLATSAWFFADDWGYFAQFVREGYALQPGELLPWATSRHRALDRMLKSLLFSQVGFASDVFHHVQLGLHVLTSILVFALVRRLVAYTPAACIAAAVFLLNRFTLDAVSWVSLLHDNLTACLSVTVLLCFARSWEDGPRGWMWFGGAALAFSLGMKAKEGLVTLPALLVVFTAFFAPRHAVRVSAVRLGLLGMLAGVFLSFAPRFVTHVPSDPYFQSFHPAVISRSFWWYAGHMVFLSDTTIAWLVDLPAAASVAGMGALLVAPLAALALPGAGGRALVFGWTMLWLGLLPTAALPNHYDYQYYAYSPMVGAAIAAGGAIAALHTLLSRTGERRLAMAVALAGAWAVIATSYAATRALPEMQWYARIGVDSRVVMRKLSEAVPSVPPHTSIVLVGAAATSPFRWVAWYDDGPSAVFQAWYRDPTLRVVLADQEPAADSDGPGSAGSDLVLVWTGDRFVPKPRGGS